MVFRGPCNPPIADHDLVHSHDERLALPRSADRDRARDRVARVELRTPRLELLIRGEVPTSVRHGDLHGIAGVDLDDGLELDREVAVEVRRVERELVNGH
jgi:hypothetical protein